MHRQTRSQFTRFFILALWLTSQPLASAQDFCRVTFDTLGSESRQGIVTRAAHLAQLPSAQRSAVIARMTRTEALAMADATLAATFAGDLDASGVSDHSVLTVHPSLIAAGAASLGDAFGSGPVAAMNPQLAAGFRRNTLGSLFTAYPNRDGNYVLGLWSELADHAAKGATPAEKRAMANALFARTRQLPLAWQPQTRYDQFIDAALGLRADAVTQALQGLSDAQVNERYGQELVWSRFGNRNLLTPYFEFQNVMDKLNPKPGQLVVDLGSGLGRQGLYTGLAKPGVKFIGYEIVKERVDESQRAANALGLSDVQFRQQDLSSPTFKPAPADFYYAFNPVSGATYLKMMNDLRHQAVAANKPFTLALAFSKDVGRMLEPGSGFVETTPPSRFEDDDFARYFTFDPSKAWKPFSTDVIAAQRTVDSKTSAAAATSNADHAITDRGSALASGRKPLPVLASIPLTVLPNQPSHGSRPAVAARAPASATALPSARPITWADRDLVQKAIDRGGARYSHVDFGSLWAWNATDGYKISQQGDAVIISGKVHNERVFFEPLGVSPAESARIMKQLSKSIQPPPTFAYVSPETAKLLRDDATFTVALDAPTQDYIYDSASLALLASAPTPNEPKLGKDLRYKRNQAAKFADGSPKPEFVPMTDANTNDVIAYLEDWGKTNAERIGPGGAKEVEASLVMLRQRAALGLEGRAVMHEGKVVGFSLGRQTGKDTFVVFAEKSRMDGVYAGAYPWLAGMQAKELAGRGITRVNRMDDGGEAHLKKAKDALEPKERPEVFSVSLAGGVGAP